MSSRPEGRCHSCSDADLARARQVFLAGCCLPAAWAGARQWCVLDAGFGLGLNFLATWAAWRADARRPERLHYVACEAHPAAAADLLRACPHEPGLQALAQALAARWHGLLPGVHRLAFDQGRVLLTLYLGDTQALLRQQQPVADSVYLGDFAPPQGSGTWGAHLLKAVARCCRRGTRVAAWCAAPGLRDGLVQCGFVLPQGAGEPPRRGALQALFDPHWQPRRGAPPLPDMARPAAAGRSALVVGAGLAGAAVAWQLAQRGWRVSVLDAASHPAAGASGLPAGVLAPHVSPDDSPLSRLSRAGVRSTLETLARLLPGRQGLDWDAGGVLEHGADAPVRLAWQDGEGLAWSAPASSAHKAACSLPAGANACWHARGGWVRPPALVAALLAQDGIRWQGGAAVARLARGEGRAPQWQALGACGALLAEAELAVVCAGPATSALLPRAWPLQPLRGQIAWGLHAELPPGLPWPAHPLNGHGNLVPCVPLVGGSGWVLGSTFERDATELPPSAAALAAGQRANGERLAALCPALGAALAPAFAQAVQGRGAIRSWAALRCAAPDHLPIVGPVDDARHPGLWACTAMGARGLTLALLCAELLAARLAGEPLPIAAALARALSSERLRA